MKVVTAILRGRIVESAIADWPRILHVRHLATPADAGYGSSRYSSTDDSFRVLYAARDFSTSFAEAVVRDRFVGKARRYLYLPYLEELCLTTISSKAHLVMLDLRGAGAYEMGVDTDASRARNHNAGQIFSQAVHDQMPEVDAILFDSRLTGRTCIAIYDRAFHALSGRSVSIFS